MSLVLLPLRLLLLPEASDRAGHVGVRNTVEACLHVRRIGRVLLLGRTRRRHRWRRLPVDLLGVRRLLLLLQWMLLLQQRRWRLVLRRQ